jgi:hypothetical protein
MRTSFHLVAESAFRQLHWSDVKWHTGHLALRTIKNLIVARTPQLPSVSCIDRLDWRMTENSGNGQRAVAQIHYQCPNLADECSMAIESNESSKCVVCQANFAPWKSRLVHRVSFPPPPEQMTDRQLKASILIRYDTGMWYPCGMLGISTGANCL